MSIKQEEPFSTLLFIFFVNDMSSYLQTVSLDYLSVDELQIHIFCFSRMIPCCFCILNLVNIYF